MRISEVFSVDAGAVPLRRIERIVTEIEQESPRVRVESIEELQESVLGLKTELSEENKLQVWRLSFRIWNICVDMANNLQQQSITSSTSSLDHIRLRQIASEMLLIAGSIGAIRSGLLKIATFFLKTGICWQKAGNLKSATNCLEKATEIVSKARDGEHQLQGTGTSEEQQFMFDLCLARSKTAWDMAQKTLASSLLGRARGFMLDNVQRHQELADVYLEFGKSLLANDDAESKTESVKYMEQAYEVCCEAHKAGSESSKDPNEQHAFTSRKLAILRYIAAGQLQNGNLEAVLKCVSVLRGNPLVPDHPSNSFLALKALVGLGRSEEAEKELIVLVSNEKATMEVCMSALSFIVEATQQLESARKAFFILHSRFSGSGNEICANLMDTLLKKASPSDCTSRKRVDIAISIVTDERVLKKFTASTGTRELHHYQKELECIHAVLWNCGSDFFMAKDYPTSIRLFEASILYLPKDEQEASKRAKSLRVLCLCHLGSLQYDRAAEYADAAEKLEPNVACSFLKFKISIQMNDEAGAANEVSKMSKCPDFQPGYLTLASHEAVACKSIKVAVSALSNMLALYSSTPRTSTETGEATMFRNLILLALQDPKCHEEVIKYLKQAQSRLAEIGADKFLGSASTRQNEASWFARCAWNQGLGALKCQNWKQCEEMFACASDFYDLYPESGDNMQCLETSLLLTVAALLVLIKEDNGEKLKLALGYLDKCRKVHATLVNKSQASATTELYLNLLAFDLKGRLKEYKEQLEIMYRCATLPGFKPDYFFKMAMHACNEGGNTEVPAAAFRSSLNLLLSSAAPDYTKAAIIMRKLIMLADQRNKDGPEVLKLYKEAESILLGLKNGVYPSEEVQWLVSTAWNRAALQRKLSRFLATEQWMNMALELLNHAPAMEVHRATMMENLNEVVNKKQLSHHVDLMEIGA